MPRKKRDKKISLTQTKKKGLSAKQKLVEDVRNNVDNFERIFLFTVRNMRSGPLKEIRTQWKHSRFFFGKSKVMALALGRTKSSEVAKNLHKVANALQGQCGLLFTNEEQDKVIEWFDNFVEPEFARSGFKANRTIVLPQGNLEDFISSMEPSLRKLGMPVALKTGKVYLREDFQVCKEGEVLTPNQAQILKLIGECIAEFRVTLHYVWTKGGNFEILEKITEGLKNSKTGKVKASKKKNTDVEMKEVVEDEDDDDDDDDDEDEEMEDD